MARYVPRQSDTCGIYVPSAYIQSHALIRRTGMPKYLKKTSLDSHFRCNGLPKEANPEVRGKSKTCRPDPPLTHSRPVVLLVNNGLWSAGLGVTAHFRKMGVSAADRSGDKCCSQQEKHCG